MSLRDPIVAEGLGSFQCPPPRHFESHTTEDIKYGNVWVTHLVHHHSPSRSRPNVPGLSPLIAASMAEESCRTAPISSSSIASLLIPESPWRSPCDTPRARWRAVSLSVPRNESIERRSGWRFGCSESAFRTAAEVADKRCKLYRELRGQGVESYLSLRIGTAERPLDRRVSVGRGKRTPLERRATSTR